MYTHLPGALMGVNTLSSALCYVSSIRAIVDCHEPSDFILLVRYSALQWCVVKSASTRRVRVGAGFQKHFRDFSVATMHSDVKWTHFKMISCVHLRAVFFHEA